jgi:demethylmenaquinone methyltransferase/2-methoxy-6-polyprenyl-1,4-benzoquinol methylase
MTDKGTVFDGPVSGKAYDRLAGIFGFGPSIHRKAAEMMPLERGQVILDLGCGTGAFCAAIAHRIGETGEIHGVDLSKKQLDEARMKMETKGARFIPHLCSMDELPFPPTVFDLVISSLAIHAATPPARRATIRETARVLKKGGRFVLVDWTRPRGFLNRVLYLPFSPYIMGEKAKDNWNNAYVALAEKEHLELTADVFLNSFVRYQCFAKGSG